MLSLQTYLRKGVSLGYVERNLNLKYLKDRQVETRFQGWVVDVLLNRKGGALQYTTEKKDVSDALLWGVRGTHP